MIIAEEQLCRASTEFAKSALDFYCSAPSDPEVWSATGTWIAAIFAAVAALIALMVHLNDKRQHRLQEIRVSIADLISVTNDLIFLTDDLRRDNLADRSRVYQKSILFELSAYKPIDNVRFNAAVNWILKASGLRLTFMKNPENFTDDHSLVAFMPRLVHELTESLRTYDLKKGHFDIVQDIVKRFDGVISERQFSSNEHIFQSLVGQEKDYMNLLLLGHEAETHVQP